MRYKVKVQTEYCGTIAILTTAESPQAAERIAREMCSYSISDNIIAATTIPLPHYPEFPNDTTF